MPTEFVLGPSLESVTEPGEAAPMLTAGRRGIAFAAENPSEPGGVVNLVMLPGQPGDAVPTNVYVFWVNPPSSVPNLTARTPDWFFRSKAPVGSIEAGHAPDTLRVQVAVTPGVYFVQTVLEYPA